MNKFGKSSLKRLAECHKDLQLLCNSVLQDMDITILCGYRGEAEQNEAFKSGVSQLKFPLSKHNSVPSKAVDVAPWINNKVDWENIPAFEKMCKLFEQHAEKLGIEIRLGRDFSFKDFPHIELVDKK